MYSFDERGWLSLSKIAGRTISVEPPAHGGAPTVGQAWPNWTGEAWVLVVYSEPVVNLTGLKAQKIAAIRAHFGSMVDALKADCANYEVDTWPQQAMEYSAWLANNATPTPYVSALAAARGLMLAELMAKIGPKVAGLATIQGTQHALEKAAAAATTEAELNAVVW